MHKFRAGKACVSSGHLRISAQKIGKEASRHAAPFFKNAFQAFEIAVEHFPQQLASLFYADGITKGFRGYQSPKERAASPPSHRHICHTL
jgi:hypothetical protein